MPTHQRGLSCASGRRGYSNVVRWRKHEITANGIQQAEQCSGGMPRAELEKSME